MKASNYLQKLKNKMKRFINESRMIQKTYLKTQDKKMMNLMNRSSLIRYKIREYKNKRMWKKFLLMWKKNKFQYLRIKKQTTLRIWLILMKQLSQLTY